MNYWIFLPSRRVITLTGPERLNFLQGLVTQDVENLNQNAAFTAVLTPQGRFHSEAFLVPWQDTLFLDCHAAHLESLLTLLKTYAPLHNVQVTASQDYAVCSAMGPEILAICSVNPNQLIQDPLSRLWFKDPRDARMGARALVPYEYLHTSPHPLLMPEYEERYRYHRMLLSLPEGADDLIPNQSILLEYGYQDFGAISWDKGCYQGQELMARTFYRGEIRKKICTLRVDGPPLFPPLGEAIFHLAEKVGLMGGHCRDIGLACMSTSFLQSWPSDEVRVLTWGDNNFLMVGRVTN